MAGSEVRPRVGSTSDYTVYREFVLIIALFAPFKMSSDKETRIALLLMEASRSGVRDPNLRDVVTDYFTHESETVSLILF